MTSNKIKKISIFAYTNNQIGAGHYNRAKFLYEYLKNFFLCSFFVNKKITKKRLGKSKFLILDDHYKNLNNILLKDLFSIALDYYGKSKFNRNLLVIKQNKIYTNKNDINLNNIIINKKGLDEHKKIKEKKKTILISLGSTNKKNLISKLIHCLRFLNFNITVITGKYNLEKLKIKKKNIKIFSHRSDFYKLLKKHEYIITNTATTFFESIYLGKKILSIPQTKFESKLYKKIYKKNFNNYFIKKKHIKKNDFNKIKKMEFKGEIKIKKILDGK